MNLGEITEYSALLSRVEVGGNDGAAIADFGCFEQAMQEKYKLPLSVLVRQTIKYGGHREKPPILEFTVFNYPLSNFYPARIEHEGLIYPTSEHAYQAQKTEDPTLRLQFTIHGDVDTPGEARIRGHKLPLRAGWNALRLSVMEQMLRLKFSDPVLHAFLLDTYPAYLEEGNWWRDTYCGVCKGVGENHLGKLLMKVREDIMHNENNDVKTIDQSGDPGPAHESRPACECGE